MGYRNYLYIADKKKLNKVRKMTKDWDYIVKNNCLCWFWDGINSLEESSCGCLILYDEDTGRYYNGEKWYENCRPVRKDEVSFYEDKKDDQSWTDL